MDQSPAASGGVWEQVRDPASGNVFFANRLLRLSRWDRPPGVEFIPLPPLEPQQQQQQQAPPAGPPNITLKQFMRRLEKSSDGRWVQSANPTDVTQQKQLAVEMITVLATQFLEDDPEVIRKRSFNDDGLLALGGALLARVNW